MFYNPIAYVPFIGPLLVILVPIAIALKGYALWHAAKRGEVWWFIALMVINTLGILELVYIIRFLKKTPSNLVDELKGATVKAESKVQEKMNEKKDSPEAGESAGSH